MKIIILTLVLLVCLALADNTVTVDCHQCGAVACVVLNGGGFNGKDMPTNVSNCASAGNFPATAKF